jgi:hypothetical protein
VPKKLKIKQVTLKSVTITPGDQMLKLKFPFSHRIAEALGWAQELPEMTGTWLPDVPHNRVEVRTIEFRPTDETQTGRGFHRVRSAGIAIEVMHRKLDISMVLQIRTNMSLPPVTLSELASVVLFSLSESWKMWPRATLRPNLNQHGFVKSEPAPSANGGER